MRLAVDHRLPLLEGHVLERHCRRAGAGVVEEDVETAERRLGLFEQSGDRLRIADIGRHDQSPRAGGLRRLRDRVERLAAAPGEDNGIATPGKRQRCGAADTGACSRDEGDSLGHIGSFYFDP